MLLPGKHIEWFSMADFKLYLSNDDSEGEGENWEDEQVHRKFNRRET